MASMGVPETLPLALTSQSTRLYTGDSTPFPRVPAQTSLISFWPQLWPSDKDSSILLVLLHARCIPKGSMDVNPRTAVGAGTAPLPPYDSSYVGLVCKPQT